MKNEIRNGIICVDNSIDYDDEMEFRLKELYHNRPLKKLFELIKKHHVYWTADPLTILNIFNMGDEQSLYMCPAAHIAKCHYDINDGEEMRIFKKIRQFYARELGVTLDQVDFGMGGQWDYTEKLLNKHAINDAKFIKAWWDKNIDRIKPHE